MSFRRLIVQLLWIYGGLVFLSLLLALLNQPVPPILTPISTSVCFIFALLHAGYNLGWRRAAAFLVIAFSVSLLLESLGVATGYVYGPYHYTDSLGPKFLGLVPYLVPLAWFMMMYPSLVIADRLLPAQADWKSETLRRLAAAALGGVIMTAWDLSLDPLMVASNHWVWDIQGVYFGDTFAKLLGLVADGFHCLLHLPGSGPPAGWEGCPVFAGSFRWIPGHCLPGHRRGQRGD